MLAPHTRTLQSSGIEGGKEPGLGVSSVSTIAGLLLVLFKQIQGRGTLHKTCQTRSPGTKLPWGDPPRDTSLPTPRSRGGFGGGVSPSSQQGSALELPV